MKFERTAAFKRDYKGLPDEHKEQFRDATRTFHDDAVAAASGTPDPWTNGLRVKTVQGAKGIWEMTWSKKNPDGRATWEWAQIEGEQGVRWRRVGDHSVFDSP